MKFTIDRKELNNAINLVLPGVAGKPVLPVLNGIRCCVREDKLHMETTDLNIFYETETDVRDVEDPTEVIIPAEQLNNIVKALEDDTLAIVFENNHFSVKSEHGTFDIPYITEEFPNIPTSSKQTDEEITLTGSQFKEIIRKIAYATIKKADRPIFTGMYIDIKQNQTSFVCTDTHRLSIFKLDREGSKDCNINIPAATMNDISKMVEDTDEIKISFAENFVIITTGKVTVTLHGISGQFPDYNRIIPKNHQTAITVKRNAFLNVLNRVSLFSGMDSDYKIIRLMVTGNELRIQSYGTDAGHGEETMECTKEGNDINIAFNVKFLTDFCKCVTEDEIQMFFINSLAPALVKAKEVDNHIYVLTPVRTANR